MKPIDLQVLAAKIADGTASDEELSAYATYLNYLEKLNKVDDLGMVEKERIKNTVKAKLLDELFQEPIQPQVKKWRFAYTAAAVAMFCCGLAGFYWLLSNHKAEQQMLVTNKPVEMAPNNKQAMLTLSDGSTIALDEAQEGKIATQGNTKVLKTKEGMLIYENGDRAKELTEPVYNTVRTPTGNQYQLVLPDGSNVWLNASSSITYPTRFTGNERKVEVQGEAYFEVKQQLELPFIVQLADQQITVLGTSFNVKDYPESFSETVLLQGSVKVSAKTSDGGERKEVVLKVGEKVSMEHKNMVVRAADLEDAIAWKMGFFKFQDDLKGIMAQIARWYDVEIVYQLRADKSIAFGGKIARNRPLREVLNILEETGNVRFKIDGRRVMVMN